MAYNSVDGKLYAMMSEDHQDDKNNFDMMKADIFTIDTRTGELEFRKHGSPDW